MTEWILALLLAVAPPGRVPARESEADARARYVAIARDVAEVVEAAPPLVGGDHPRERTAAILVAVAALESGLRADVDRGELRGRLGECGLWQTMPVGGGCPRDRRDGARLALERMRRSFAACASSPFDERLAVYASGSCRAGLAASRARLGLARRLFAAHPPPVMP